MVDLGWKNAWNKLTTSGVVVLVIVALVLAVFAVIGFVRTVFEQFIPIDASMLPQRAVTDMIEAEKNTNLPVALPSKWNPATEFPMMSRVMINNKLRGDELQKKLQKLKSVNSPLNKFL